MTTTSGKLAGVVVLAAGIVAAVRGTEDQKSPWKQEFRGGVTVELIGVSTQPPESKDVVEAGRTVAGSAAVRWAGDFDACR